MGDWTSVLTPFAIILLAVLLFFRDRIVQRPENSAERKLAETYKDLLEAQLLEINGIKQRMAHLERYRIAVEVLAEELARHAPELTERLLSRFKEAGERHDNR